MLGLSRSNMFKQANLPTEQRKNSFLLPRKCRDDEKEKSVIQEIHRRGKSLDHSAKTIHTWTPKVTSMSACNKPRGTSDSASKALKWSDSSWNHGRQDDVLWLAQLCDEWTWHHKTFLLQLYWHQAIRPYCILTKPLLHQATGLFLDYDQIAR